MLWNTLEDFYASYSWFNPAAWITSNCLSQHRKINQFSWQTDVPVTCHSEDAEMVAASPTKRKGTCWWIWGTQTQRSYPVELPTQTEARWWPMSHFHWPAHLVTHPSNALSVSMGLWEHLVTEGEITTHISSSSVEVTFPEGHKVVDGIYGIRWTNTSGSFLTRTSVNCSVDGNVITLSGGSGSNFFSNQVGRTLEISHYDTSETVTTHCWKPKMGLYCTFAKPEVEQPQYRADQTLYGAVREVVTVANEIVTLDASLTLGTGTRPPGNTSTSYFYGDLVYLRSPIPPQQKGTVASVDTDYGYGGTISFPDGHHFAIGDTVERIGSTFSGYINFNTATPLAYTVDAADATSIHITNAEYSRTRPGYPNYTLPAVGNTVVLMPGHPWRDIGTISSTVPPPSLSGKHVPPIADGVYGEFATTERIPVQALKSVKPTFHIDTAHLDGYRITFELVSDRQRDPVTGVYSYDYPLKVVGDSLRFWVGNDYYLEVTLSEIDGATHYLERTIRNAAGVAITKVWRTLHNTPTTEVYSFTLNVQPAYHQVGYLISHGRIDFGAYIHGPLPSTVSCERSDGTAIQLSKLEAILTVSQAAITLDAIDGNYVTLTLDDTVAVPPPGGQLKIRMETEDENNVYTYLQTVLGRTYNAVLVDTTVARASRGTLVGEDSILLNNVGVTNILPDGTHTVNLFWGDDTPAKKVEGTTATKSGTLLTFTGGTGDDLPDVYQTMSGNLYYRDSDSVGYVQIGTSNGLLSNTIPINLSWTLADVEYTRTGCVLYSVGATTTAFKEGTGDPLPIVGTEITIHQPYITVHVCESPASPEIKWGGTYQFDIGSAPVTPISRVNVSYSDTVAMNLPSGYRYLKEPNTRDHTHPWGYRVTVSGYPNSSVNGTHLLNWSYEGRTANGEYNKIVLGDNEVASGELLRRSSDSVGEIVAGVYEGLTNFDRTGTVTLSWTLLGVDYERTGCTVAVGTFFPTITQVSGGTGDALPVTGTTITITKPGIHKEYFYLQVGKIHYSNEQWLTWNRLADMPIKLVFQVSGNSLPFPYDYVTYFYVPEGATIHPFIDSTMDAIIADAPQYVRTSEGPVEGHVFDYPADVSDGDPTITARYDGMLSLYHAKTDDAHGTLRTPDDALLLPPVGWTGNLLFDANDGVVYTVHATIEITGRNGKDATFTVTAFLPSGTRNTLPPVAEVTNVRLTYELGKLSDVAPDLTFTIECVDHEDD